MLKIDLIGKVFDRNTVIDERGRDRFGQVLWLCQCSCGNEHLVTGGRLRRGESKSCGCLRHEGGPLRHGDSARGRLTPEYRTWSNMIDRCERPGNKSYKDYGGRGIAVCARWRGDFALFLADMGRKPSALHSIDRIRNDEGYGPGNCRWATRQEQNRNKRSNIRIIVGERSQLLVEWAREVGIKEGTIDMRIRSGWDPADAVTTPVRKPGMWFAAPTPRRPPCP